MGKNPVLSWVAVLVLAALSLQAQATDKVERWGVFEASFHGPQNGNPFLDTKLSVSFRQGHRVTEVQGFYDGGGVYRVRFMPDSTGTWSYLTKSNRPELDGKSGALLCTPNMGVNHGPVVVRNTYHFGYADGTPYTPVGTTAYAWAHQGNELEEQTLRTLRDGPFNKIRMCVFPKSYAFNKNEPQFYPFPRDQSGTNDFSQFNPEFFRHFEQRVRQLMEMGIEADLILFHPYDRWGYQAMPAEVDDRYLRYLVARLAAYRNVWWSMANEWDFMKAKKLSDFDRFFHVVEESDPYQHLRSIHNGAVLYDHAKPWVTHASIQGDDFAKTPDYLSAYKKPVVWDECKYEGNIPQRWGNLAAQEMVRRFWLGTVSGSYVGHGETYLDPREILWWSKGGTLHGESPKRIAFLRKIVEESAPEGLDPLPGLKYLGAMASSGSTYLYYLDLHQPAELEFDLPTNTKFAAEVIDPWEMTIAAVAGEYQGKFTLKLPGKPYQAVRFRKIRP